MVCLAENALIKYFSDMNVHAPHNKTYWKIKREKQKGKHVGNYNRGNIKCDRPPKRLFDNSHLSVLYWVFSRVTWFWSKGRTKIIGVKMWSKTSIFGMKNADLFKTTWVLPKCFSDALDILLKHILRNLYEKIWWHSDLEPSWNLEKIRNSAFFGWKYNFCLRP